MQLIKRVGYEKIYELDSFDKDYRKMFGKGGAHNSYYKKFLENLKVLDNVSSIEHALIDQRFELIDGESHIYSIRHKSKMNPRVLFFHTTADGVYILLCGFLEKSKSDYDVALRKAKGILKELEQ